MLGRRVDTEHDVVEVDGAPVGARPGLVYYLLNKPPGVVTTAQDTHGRPDGGRARPARAAGVPGRAPRRRHRGAAAADQRRRAGQPGGPPQPRARQGVPGHRAHRRRPGRPRARCAGCATASTWTTAAPRRPRSPSPSPASCASRSTRAATARSGGCARRSAIPVTRLVRTRIGPLHDRRLRPGTWRPLTHGRGHRPGQGDRRGTDRGRRRAVAKSPRTSPVRSRP